ncbi:hypothetical protein [Pseudoruegeria sp. HB172150]|uniref:hypothetical protein n=1 Tax=Pseudoruegeria sp. HB172150 TaxID=2721164 RepID=UPI001552A4DC|nr:hypothetical protein [Pseudoruegeria sp. HB172150]
MKFGSPPTTFVYHLGVHCTDDDLLVQSLLQDSARLEERQILVPRPRAYRKLVRDQMHENRGNPAPEAEQKVFYDKLLPEAPVERVIFSDADYTTLPRGVFEHRQLYSKAGFRTAWLRYLFPENPCEFFFAMRNPATYLPEVLQRKGMPDYEKFVNGVDPRNMLWSGVIERIQKNNPGCPVTVWCNEDTPLIWPEILRAITGTEANYHMTGDFDLLRGIMKEEGLVKLEHFLSVHPPATAIHRRRIISAFLDKFALEEELEEEIDLPGWTPDFVDEVSATYDADMETIAAMPDVTLIMP